MSFGCTLVAAIEQGCEISRTEAVEMAQKIIAAGAQQGLAGSVHYWPQKFSALAPAERNALIREAFNGRNLREVCRQFDVSPATVYRALHEQA